MYEEKSIMIRCKKSTAFPAGATFVLRVGDTRAIKRRVIKSTLLGGKNTGRRGPQRLNLLGDLVVGRLRGLLSVGLVSGDALRGTLA